MSQNATLPDTDDVVYPDSDGRRMAENTLQYEWIVTLQGNLDLLYRDRPDVFVAGDHLIYAVKGKPKRRRAPDAYVAFGRPKGHRGSYKVWVEGGIFPQVIFEVLSPGNRTEEMRRKLKFYRHYGAEEYYVLDPDNNTLEAWHRTGTRFLPVTPTHGLVSPRLGIRFEVTPAAVRVFNPDGTPFLTFVEIGLRAAQERERADIAQQRADAAQQRADAERSRADEAQQRADAAQRKAADEAAVREKLAAKLREMGVDPDHL